MKIITMISQTGKKVELRYDHLDEPGKEVTVYQDKTYAGTYSLAIADAGIAKAIASGMQVKVTS